MGSCGLPLPISALPLHGPEAWLSLFLWDAPFLYSIVLYVERLLFGSGVVEVPLTDRGRCFF